MWAYRHSGTPQDASYIEELLILGTVSATD